MPEDRFAHLEPEEPQKPEAPALPQLSPFEHLEIGEVGHPPSKQSSPPLSATPDSVEGDAPCRNCGRLNERERETCWACFKLLRPKTSPAGPPPTDVTLVLDGKTYRSTDPGLPEDVGTLFQKIQKEGYSERLMAQWRSGRAARGAGLPEPKAQEGEPIKVFKDQRRSVIRLDGTLYYDDEPNLTPELKQLFAYLAANGVTPELMERLRHYGNKVKLRPHTTAQPSDGDLAFWKQVNDSTLADQKPPGPFESRSGRLFLAAFEILVYGVIMYLFSSDFQQTTGDDFRRWPAQTAQAEGTILEILRLADYGPHTYDGGVKVRASFTTKSGQEVPIRFIAGGYKNIGMEKEVSPIVDTEFPVRYDPENPKNCAVGHVGDPFPASSEFKFYYAFLGVFTATLLYLLWLDLRPLFPAD